jgi:hypothetical protein
MTLLYIGMGVDGDFPQAPSGYFLPSPWWTRYLQETPRAHTKAHYPLHGLGHSPNSSPSATSVWLAQQSGVAEYIWIDPDLPTPSAMRDALKTLRRYASLKTPFRKTQWEKTEWRKEHVRLADLHTPTLLTVVFGLASMVNDASGDDVSFLFSRLHAPSQHFWPPSPALAAREPGSGETDDSSVSGDAGGGGRMHRGSQALGLLQATRRGGAAPRGPGWAEKREPNAPQLIRSEREASTLTHAGRRIA